ncbi:pyocin activator PrtN family protein [Bradyrhizobium erythrophlei]|uniref:Pyocin activator protein PrtN n=1 Tax=Bradyrhizobium erythrophlei TaxID=1437360 RepID=A0A1M5RNG6_9BRAD|nr:pyocin activator PrtN family protein [Bradyrhizobium erythrophlei]SHH27802.1 Pyocin activator protein PrtN [Bradyrhizobium erythrophlei]
MRKIKTERGEFGSTLFFLMGQYGSRAVIPADEVRRDYFSHLALMKFLRKCDNGEIALPLMRAEKSQQSARGVYIQDLATYIDNQRAAALSVMAKQDPWYDYSTTGAHTRTYLAEK